MDKETIFRTLIAGAIIIAVMWAWPYAANYFWPAKPVPKPAETAPKTPGETPAKGDGEKTPAVVPPEKTPPEKTPSEPAVAKAPQIVAEGGAEADVKPVLLGSATYEGRYDLEAAVSPRGAAVERLTLARHRFFRDVADRSLPSDEREAMDLVTPDTPHAALTIPELRLKLKGVDAWSQIDLSGVVWKAGPAAADGSSVALSVDVKESGGATLLTVRKTFTLFERKGAPEGDVEEVPQYEMAMALEFVSADERVEKVAYALQGPPALPREGRRADFRQVAFGTWAEGRIQAEQLAGTKIKKADDAPADAPPTMSLAGSELAWAGQVDKYFAVLVVPQKPSPSGTFAAGGEAVQYTVTEQRKDVALARVRLLSKELAVTAGEPLRHDYNIYAGPKDPGHLEAHYTELGFDGLIQWTMCCVPIPGLSVISRFLLGVIELFHTLVSNYGVAIIMLVLMLRLVLLPVSKWSAKSMAEMQKMAPKMQQIRQEFANDQKRMQEEMSKIGGFKAFGGCLPMFVQMPIWIALYGALGAAIQLRHANFLPSGWVPDGSLFLQDLSAPDALVHWATPFYLPGQEIPLLGWLIGSIQGMLGGGITSFNLLPIIMAVVMFLQQRLTQTTSTGPQADQQKKMMMFMTVFFALVLYSAPSGLCLYIATSMSLGLVENKFFRRKWVEAAKAKADAPKLPPGDVKERSLVTGRDKSIGERAEAWLKQRMAPPKGKGTGNGKRGKRKK